jgi:hypothetical protein
MLEGTFGPLSLDTRWFAGQTTGFARFSPHLRFALPFAVALIEE